MTPWEIRQISDWAASQTQTHDLFMADTSHPEQPAFDAFASELTRTAPCIRITASGRQRQIPTLFISDHIGVSALPLGRGRPPGSAAG